MCHCALFLFPLTLGTALNSFVGVGVASTSSHVSSVPLLPQCNCSPHLILFPLAVKSSPHHIFHSAAEKYQKEVEGKLALLLFCIPQHVLLPMSTTPSALFPSPPLLTLTTPHSLLPPLHPPISDSHLCTRWTGLISALANIHSPPLSLLSPPSSPFYPSSALLLTSPRSPPFSSSFQFPLLK